MSKVDMQTPMTDKEINDKKVELYNKILADPKVDKETKRAIKLELMDRIAKKLI